MDLPYEQFMETAKQIMNDWAGVKTKPKVPPALPQSQTNNFFQ